MMISEYAEVSRIKILNSSNIQITKPDKLCCLIKHRIPE